MSLKEVPTEPVTNGLQYNRHDLHGGGTGLDFKKLGIDFDRQVARRDGVSSAVSDAGCHPVRQMD